MDIVSNHPLNSKITAVFNKVLFGVDKLILRLASDRSAKNVSFYDFTLTWFIFVVYICVCAWVCVI